MNTSSGHNLRVGGRRRPPFRERCPAVPLFAPDIVPFKGTNRRNYPPGLTHRAVSFSGDAGLSEVRELG